MSRELTTVKRKPDLALVKIHDRSVSVQGFRHPLMEEHLTEHLGLLSEQWCEIGCLARTMFGKNIPANRTAIRKRLRRAWNYFLDRDVLLVIEYEPRGYGHNGESKAVKLFCQTDLSEPSAERQYAEVQLERMKKRREITGGRYIKACALLGAISGHQENKA